MFSSLGFSHFAVRLCVIIHTLVELAAQCEPLQVPNALGWKNVNGGCSDLSYACFA